MNRNKARRAHMMAERTGKPHLYVYNGVKFTEWLWANPPSYTWEGAEYVNNLAGWCARMDSITGYDTVEDR